MVGCWCWVLYVVLRVGCKVRGLPWLALWKEGQETLRSPRSFIATQALMLGSFGYMPDNFARSASVQVVDTMYLNSFVFPIHMVAERWNNWIVILLHQYRTSSRTAGLHSGMASTISGLMSEWWHMVPSANKPNFIRTLLPIPYVIISPAWAWQKKIEKPAGCSTQREEADNNNSG